MGYFVWNVEGNLRHDIHLGEDIVEFFRDFGWNLYLYDDVDKGIRSKIISRGPVEGVKKENRYLVLPRCAKSDSTRYMDKIQRYVVGSPSIFFQRDVYVGGVVDNGIIKDGTGVESRNCRLHPHLLNKGKPVHFFGVIPRENNIVIVTQQNLPNLVLPYEAIFPDGESEEETGMFMDHMVYLRDINVPLEEWE